MKGEGESSPSTSCLEFICLPRAVFEKDYQQSDKRQGPPLVSLLRGLCVYVCCRICFSFVSCDEPKHL